MLHKPGVHPDERTPPEECPADFIQADALSAWQAHALAAVRALIENDSAADNNLTNET